MNRRAVLALGGTLPLAGCSLLNGIGGAGVPRETGSTGTGPPETTRPTRTTTGDAGTADGDGAATAMARSGSLAEVVIRLSDLPREYEQNGETDVSRSSAADDLRRRLRRLAILRQLSRTFVNAGGADGPALALSEATAFESREAAASRRDDLVRSFTDGGGTAETVEVASDVTVDRVRFESERGARNVLVYHRTGDLLLNLVASGEETYFEERARSLMVRMIADL